MMSCVPTPSGLENALPNTWGIDKDLLSLKEQAASEHDLGTKEHLFDQIDELTKERDTHLEVILKAIYREAFATVKETARRF